MSDTPETLSAILAELRAEMTAVKCAGDIQSLHETQDLLRDFADRIERAAKNTENAFGMALAIEDGLHKRDKQSAPGNTAAMRDALGEIVLLTLKAGISLRSDVACGIVRSKARHALSAPARNCDVGTPKEQVERWEGFCNRNWNTNYASRGLDPCDDCELVEFGNCRCQFLWAQMPFAPAEGGAKCIDGLRGHPDCRGYEEHCLDVRKRNCFYWNPDIGKCALDGKPSCRIACDNFHVSKKEKPAPADGGAE